MISLILFVVAAVLYVATAAWEADVSIWGHFFVALGLVFANLGDDPRKWLKRPSG